MRLETKQKIGTYFLFMRLYSLNWVHIIDGRYVVQLGMNLMCYVLLSS